MTSCHRMDAGSRLGSISNSAHPASAFASGGCRPPDDQLARLALPAHSPSSRPLPRSPGVVIPSPTIKATQVDCWAGLQAFLAKLISPTEC